MFTSLVERSRLVFTVLYFLVEACFPCVVLLLGGIMVMFRDRGYCGVVLWYLLWKNFM